MKSKLLSKLLIILISISLITGVYMQVNAQEEIVNYLYDRFEQKNIPVIEITVLEKSPLSLQIVIQSENQWVTGEDMRLMKLVDREVLVFARQEGYFVDSYTRILKDSHGNQIDLVIQKPDLEKISRANFSHATLSDSVVQNMIEGRIKSEINKFSLNDVELKINVVSDLDGLQTLTLDAMITSLEQANNAVNFLMGLPYLSVIDEVNLQGGRIVFYIAKVTDENNENLFNYVLDIEMQSGSLIIDNKLQNPRGDGPSPALEIDTVSTAVPEITIETTSTPTETITPTP